MIFLIFSIRPRSKMKPCGLEQIVGMFASLLVSKWPRTKRALYGSDTMVRMFAFLMVSRWPRSKMKPYGLRLWLECLLPVWLQQDQGARWRSLTGLRIWPASCFSSGVEKTKNRARLFAVLMVLNRLRSKRGPSSNVAPKAGIFARITRARRTRRSHSVMWRNRPNSLN